MKSTQIQLTIAFLLVAYVIVEAASQSDVGTPIGGRFVRSVPALYRYVRAPMDRSSMVRFGKRAPMDRSAMIRFGKRYISEGSMSNYLKRAPMDRSSMVRFGKRSSAGSVEDYALQK